MRWDDELMALALSANGIAARKSAAALYGLLPPPKQHHLLVARSKRNLDRVVVHSSFDLPCSDVTKVGVIPATTPIRTVIDVAGDLPMSAVNRLVDRAMTRRGVRLIPLERRARELRAPGRPGAARVLSAIDDAHPSIEKARNEFEGALLRVLRAAGLPDPIPNHRVVIDRQVRFLDDAWPEPMVSLELDGYLPHIESRDVFDDDRVRQNELVDAGWKVFRVTPRLLRGDTKRLLAPIMRAVLGNESHIRGG
jgi:very-short-patch-repair endonuclease